MRVHIPSALRRWTGGREVIEMPLALDMRMTAAEVIEAVAREHPGIRDRVLDEQGQLRRHVNIFIDGENARGLGGSVGASSFRFRDVDSSLDIRRRMTAHETM